MMGAWRQRLLAAALGTAAAFPATMDAAPKQLPKPVPSTPPLRMASRQTSLTPVEEEVVATESGPALNPGCENGECPPYHRNRPRHCQANRIKLQNRLSEPEWYHYYRCEHYGYHPTQWHAWPEGWLRCRHPQPGDHPYDIERPKPDKRILERERQLEGSRERPDLLDEPLPPRNSEQTPPVAPPGDSPRELPPPQGTTPMPVPPDVKETPPAP